MSEDLEGCEKQVPYAVLGLSLESEQNRLRLSLVEIKSNDVIT